MPDSDSHWRQAHGASYQREGPGVTRWKREFLDWTKRERLEIFFLPRKWQDWTAAKSISLVCDYKMRQLPKSGI